MIAPKPAEALCERLARPSHGTACAAAPPLLPPRAARNFKQRAVLRLAAGRPAPPAAAALTPQAAREQEAAGQRRRRRQGSLSVSAGGRGRERRAIRESGVGPGGSGAPTSGGSADSLIVGWALVCAARARVCRMGGKRGALLQSAASIGHAARPSKGTYVRLTSTPIL